MAKIEQTVPYQAACAGALVTGAVEVYLPQEGVGHVPSSLGYHLRWLKSCVDHQKPWPLFLRSAKVRHSPQAACAVVRVGEIKAYSSHASAMPAPRHASGPGSPGLSPVPEVPVPDFCLVLQLWDGSDGECHSLRAVLSEQCSQSSALRAVLSEQCLLQSPPKLAPSQPARPELASKLS